MFFVLWANARYDTDNRYTLDSNISLKNTKKKNIFCEQNRNLEVLGKGNRDWFTSQYFVICWSKN